MPFGASDDDTTPDDSGSVADPLNGDSLSYPDWLARRNAQIADGAGDDVPSAGVDGPPAAPPQAPSADDGDGLPLSYDPATRRFKVLSSFDQPTADDRIVSGTGDDSLIGGGGDDAIRRTAAGPLTGSTPISKAVADAVDRIVSGPNTSAPIHLDGFEGELRRGQGQDVHLKGTVKFERGPPVSGAVDGLLSQSAAQPGVTTSNLKGPRGVKLPPSIHLFNTATGQLEYELDGPAGLGFVTLKKPGRYPIQ